MVTAPPAEIDQAAIVVRDLRMRCGSKDVLHGVDFNVRRGEVVTLLGPNGAGKTTIIEILEGFRMRSAGSVSVLGSDPAHADERWRARLGIVPRPRRVARAGAAATSGSFYVPYSTADRARPRDADELSWRWG